jgi:hypothetical protein
MDFFRHLFLPHHTNNYRAKAIHLDSLTIYAVILLVFQVFIRTIHSAAPEVLGYSTDINVEMLLSETNAERTKLGLNTLELNGQLSKAASEKAKHMFSNNYWAHVGPDGKTPWDFINDSGYAYQYAGENLAKNFMTSQEVVNAWMASPTHRDNIVKPIYADIGFAVVNGMLEGEETTLVVQMFGRPHNYHLVQKNNSAISKEAISTSNQVLPDTNVQQKQEAKSIHTGDTNGLSLDSLVFGVKKSPLIDMNKVNTGVVGGFITFLLFVLTLDAVVVYKRRHVRVVGHPIGHIAFLLLIACVSLIQTSGAIL